MARCRIRGATIATVLPVPGKGVMAPIFAAVTAGYFCKTMSEETSRGLRSGPDAGMHRLSALGGKRPFAAPKRMMAPVTLTVVRGVQSRSKPPEEDRVLTAVEPSLAWIASDYNCVRASPASR